MKSTLKSWSAAQLNVASSREKWIVEEDAALNNIVNQIYQLDLKWNESQLALINDIKASKASFVSILKQQEASESARKSTHLAFKQVKKAERTLTALRKKGGNTATAETKLRQAQSIYELCENESNSM